MILLDEPAAGTNPSEKLELTTLIRRVRDERGVSVLLIEHDMKLVMALAERLYVLNWLTIAEHPRKLYEQAWSSTLPRHLCRRASA